VSHVRVRKHIEVRFACRHTAQSAVRYKVRAYTRYPAIGASCRTESSQRTSRDGELERKGQPGYLFDAALQGDI
jgi:hypothetical protein